MRTLRLLGKGWLFHVKGLTASGFFVLTSTIQPVRPRKRGSAGSVGLPGMFRSSTTMRG